MSIHLKSVSLTSDDILKELVTDSLSNLLGEGHELISDNLPLEGHHLLALDANRRPVLVAYDNRDGGRALLSGLAAIEGLGDNRAMLYRLFPSLFRGSRSSTHDGSAIFRIEDLRLVVLAPKPPPGGAWLQQVFRNLTVHTFRILEVDGNIGLLIETPPDAVAAPSTPDIPGTSAFRTGTIVMSPEEDSYFRKQ